LRKNFSFSGVAILALALGIGFSSIVFSIFYNGVLNPFPYRDTGRLASIRVTNDQLATGSTRCAFHLDEIIAFQRESHTLEDIVAVRWKLCPIPCI
jgi:hypothetical protein